MVLNNIKTVFATNKARDMHRDASGFSFLNITPFLDRLRGEQSSHISSMWVGGGGGGGGGGWATGRVPSKFF